MPGSVKQQCSAAPVAALRAPVPICPVFRHGVRGARCLLYPPMRWLRTARRVAAFAVGLHALLWSTPAAAQPVQGDVRTLGFNIGAESRHAYRHGQWYPILVELTATSDQHFNGTLRVEARDLDGDRVQFAKSNVTVTAGAGPVRVWLYAVTLSGAEPVDRVDVLDDRGILVTTLPAPTADAIPNDSRILLDISAAPVQALHRVGTAARNLAESPLGERFYRDFSVVTLPADQLPDRAVGLEAANIIVWDEPDPQAVQDFQLQALIDWVKAGGELVVGVGPAWRKIQSSLLAEIMPFAGEGASVETAKLEFFQKHFGPDSGGDFAAPISVTTAGLAPGATRRFLDRAPGGRELNLIAARYVGAGRVVATAARLRDLFSIEHRWELVHELIELHALPAAIKENAAAATLIDRTHELVRDISGRTEFRSSASARMLTAFLFVAAYFAVAVLGVWTWLKRRNLLSLSWSAFAAVAGVSAAVSLGAVWLMRGLTREVHAFTLVNAEAGSRQASAHVFMGFRSPARRIVDLSLDGEASWLRGFSSSLSTYATPERYSANVSQGVLLATPVRATLKQLEGFWRGELVGGVAVDLKADRESGRLTRDSSVTNQFDFEIVRGYLLYIDPRLQTRDTAVPYHLSGLSRRSDRSSYLGAATPPPATAVLALELPRLRPGQSVEGIGDLPYRQFDAEYLRWESQPEPPPEKEPMLPSLWQLQTGDWVSSCNPLVLLKGTLDSPSAAALLASTRNLYLPTESNSFERYNLSVTSRDLPEMDVTHWLAGGAGEGAALLLLIADTVGPATLQVNGEPLPSRYGRTLYRYRVPIAYQGQPATRTTP